MSGSPNANTGGSGARRAAGLAAAVLVAGFLGVLGYRQLASKPAPPQEVTRDVLVLREGRLYRTNDAGPFTGALIERFPSGVLKSRSLLVRGVLEGLSEGWYTNGQVQVREHFKAGISNGSRTKWYEKGAIESETMILEGKHHGTFRRWHENGQLAETVEMNRGEPDGVSLAYYPDGFVKARARLNNGKVLEQAFWKDGELSSNTLVKGASAP